MAPDSSANRSSKLDFDDDVTMNGSDKESDDLRRDDPHSREANVRRRVSHNERLSQGHKRARRSKSESVNPDVPPPNKQQKNTGSESSDTSFYEFCKSNQLLHGVKVSNDGGQQTAKEALFIVTNQEGIKEMFSPVKQTSKTQGWQSNHKVYGNAKSRTIHLNSEADIPGITRLCAKFVHDTKSSECSSSEWQQEGHTETQGAYRFHIDLKTMSSIRINPEFVAALEAVIKPINGRNSDYPSERDGRLGRLVDLRERFGDAINVDTFLGAMRGFQRESQGESSSDQNGRKTGVKAGGSAVPEAASAGVAMDLIAGVSSVHSQIKKSSSNSTKLVSWTAGGDVTPTGDLRLAQALSEMSIVRRDNLQSIFAEPFCVKETVKSIETLLPPPFQLVKVDGVPYQVPTYEEVAPPGRLQKSAKAITSLARGRSRSVTPVPAGSNAGKQASKTIPLPAVSELFFPEQDYRPENLYNCGTSIGDCWMIRKHPYAYLLWDDTQLLEAATTFTAIDTVTNKRETVVRSSTQASVLKPNLSLYIAAPLKTKKGTFVPLGCCVVRPNCDPSVETRRLALVPTWAIRAIINPKHRVNLKGPNMSHELGLVDAKPGELASGSSSIRLDTFAVQHQSCKLCYDSCGTVLKLSSRFYEEVHLEDLNRSFQKNTSQGL